MRNLQIYEIKRTYLPQRTCNLTSVLNVNNCIFYVSNGKLFYFVEKVRISYPLWENEKCITCLTYITALDYVWFGTGVNFIFFNPLNLKKTKIVEVENSYYCATWSPNQELLAVCDVSGRIRCYKDVFDNLTVISKFLEDSNVPLAQNTAKLNPKIYWTGNSEYFCVRYFDCGYKLRIYSIEGQIEEMTLNIPNMLPNITWQNGMIVCATKDQLNQLSLAMYEKTGKFRKQFIIDEKVKEIHNMEWNESEDILAMHVSTNEGTCLNLYTQANFHFLLKQQFVYTEENPLQTFEFEHSKYFTPLVITTDRSIIFYKFLFKFQYGQLEDYIFCVEVDGPSLIFKQITGLHQKDLKLFIKCKHPINTVVFDHTFKRFVIVDSFRSLSVYNYINTSFFKTNEKLLYLAESTRFMPINYYNMCFIGYNTISCTFMNNENTCDTYTLDLDIPNMFPTKVDDCNLHILYVHEYGKVIKLKKDGQLFYDGTLKLKELTFEIHQLDYAIVEGKVHILILDVMDRFHINDCVVFRGVTSFLTHAGYLYLTTLDCNLYCVELDSQTIEDTVNEMLFKVGMYCMQCDRDSFLLCGKPEAKHILLYHTGGMIENVLCKNVAIGQVQYFIETRQWVNAYEYARMAELDMNVLADSQPQIILDNIKDFVVAFQEKNLLGTFIMNLKEENMLATFHKNCSYVKILPNKQKTFCQAILDVIKDEAKDNIKVVILSSHIVGGIDASIDVLYHLYNTYGDIEKVLTNGFNCLNLYESNNDIGKACLKKCNIDFAKCIFKKFNIERNLCNCLFKEMDKHHEDINRQFFLLHNFVQNYKEAMAYLLNSYKYLEKSSSSDSILTPQVKLLIEYATRHGLIAQLYKFSSENKLYNEPFTKVYANSLIKRNRLEDAAVVYINNLLFSEAHAIYTRCQMWQESIYAIKRSNGQRKSYLQGLARSLQYAKNYTAAAKIHEDFLGDSRSAISNLIAGNFFKQAMYCSIKHEDEDSLYDVIRPKYKDYYKVLKEKIKTFESTFMKHVERLQKLRDAEISKAVETESTSTDDSIEIIEDPSSNPSSSSPDSKKYRLRKGDAYENIALMKTLHDIIREAYELSTDIKDVTYLYLLLERDKFETTNSLQVAYEELLEIITQKIQFIWPPKLNSVNIEPTSELVAMRKNLDELDMKYRYPPEMVPTNWKYNFIEDLVD